MPGHGPRASDRELIRACQQGDESAWEAIVRKYSRLVYSIALKTGLRTDDAEDVLQAVFLNLLRSVDHLEQLDTLIPWLVTTTKRQSWKSSESAGRRARDGEEDLDSRQDAASAEEDLLGLERQIAVREAVDSLDPRCRGLLEMLFYADPQPAYAEISKAMNMPVPSIGPTRLRCLDKLRRKIAGSGLF
jgi:RNA polymerase sigma factor (sigma-70 family)